MATKKLSNWTTVSYNKNTGTFNVNWKTYSNKSDAASAINSAKGTSSWSSSSSRSNNSFIDPSVLQDQHMGMSNQDIANKWWGTNKDWTPNAAWQTKVLQALNKNNRVYWTGWYTNYDSNTWLYSKPSTSWSSSSSDNSKDTIWQYWDASYKNYTNAFNNYKSQWMSDEDARRKAASLLENEDLLKPKSEEEIAAETQKNDEEDLSWIDDIMWEIWEEEEWEEETPDVNDQLYPEWRDEFNEKLDRMEQLQSQSTESNVVPEERDTSYDYNTYFQENLAPDTTYEWWESKNELANETGLTFAEKYQEPVTQSLEELWLLTPNQEASTQEWVEEATTPEWYNNPEEIVNWFESTLEWLASQWETWITPKDAAQAYVNFKNQLKKYVDDNNMSREDYMNYLRQMKDNSILKDVLTRK